MKRVTKRVFTAVMACMMACLMFVTPVLAATNNFSKTTVKLNAISGGISRYSSVTSGSVSGSNPSITQNKRMNEKNTLFYAFFVINYQ